MTDDREDREDWDEDLFDGIEMDFEPYCLCGESCYDCDGNCEECDCDEQMDFEI